jgi:cobalt-zinc-cadmium efflux system outer membrane protein
MSLRALAYSARLSYRQALSSYLYTWKQLVAALGLRQLPLTEVAGRLDRFIPYFDYDAVLAHALRQHTDVLTARNTLGKARYNLKLAQITPIFQNMNLSAGVLKDLQDLPLGTFYTVALSQPLSIWDQNRGNIIAAEAALVRATEVLPPPHPARPGPHLPGHLCPPPGGPQCLLR